MDIVTGWIISIALIVAFVVLVWGGNKWKPWSQIGMGFVIIFGAPFTLFSIVTPIYHQEIVTYTNCSIVRTNGYITVIKDNKDNVALVSNLAPIYIAKDENIVLRQVKGVNLFNIPSFGEHYIDVVPSETNVEKEE